MRNEPRGYIMTERERVEGMLIENRLELLRGISEELREAEDTVDTIRERKWDLVKQLKDLGHDFTASTEGMDVVLSAPPSMRF
tara:strand:- start:567 stop:815 length:249 start_codon:yes stop_codon:yes gene_type:complete